jgi:regulator of cell morphogenesis and NO signaling
MIPSGTIDVESSVPDIVVDHPVLFELFRDLGIDCTCGGKSLRTACREQRLDPKEILQQCYVRLRHGKP